MTVAVRIFTYSALITAPVSASSGRLATDSVAQLKQPYLDKEQLSATTGSAVNSSASISDNSSTRLLWVQVAPGGTVHYEFTPANQTLVEATTGSPYVSGDQLFQFGPNWRISFLEFSG